MLDCFAVRTGMGSRSSPQNLKKTKKLNNYLCFHSLSTNHVLKLLLFAILILHRKPDAACVFALVTFNIKAVELRSGEKNLEPKLKLVSVLCVRGNNTHRTTMPFRNIAVGRPDEATHPDALKAALAEFISTLIFVFAGEGSGMAFNKLTDNASTTPAGLVAAALAHAFGLFVAVSVGANISGGHVNPAVTFGAFVGGNITLLRGILYWIAQLLGSTVACLLLKFATNGLVRLYIRFLLVITVIFGHFIY
jgi:hypothetical protein